MTALPVDDVRPWRPEDGDTRCQQCGQPNPIWWADNAQWNATVGGSDATDDPGGVLCPTCYHAKWLGREVGSSTPPADDVREALAAARNVEQYLDMLAIDMNDPEGGVIDDGYDVLGVIQSLAVPDLRSLIAFVREVRPHGTVTDAGSAS